MKCYVSMAPGKFSRVPLKNAIFQAPLALTVWGLWFYILNIDIDY